MLYLTTRDSYDTFTVAHTLRGDRAGNGGLYLPFRLPELSADDFGQMAGKSFGQNAAEILNRFFSCGITGWDIEFSVGRHPVKLTGMKQRVIACELWHNQFGKYSWLEWTLAEKICGKEISGTISSWVRIGIRIAVIISAYADMLRTGAVAGGEYFDAAVPTGDFTAAMALCYARKMGLPVQTIICGCNKNSAVWELLHIGQFRTDVSVIETTTPEADFAVPQELERLISARLGAEEAVRYCEICAKGGIYALDPPLLSKLNQGMFAAVVSSRLDAVIPNVYRTSGYLMGPYTALAHSALQDYRARTGENRVALLLADKSPVCDAAFIARALDIEEQQIAPLLNHR